MSGLTDAERETLKVALRGHHLDTMSQDSGQHCDCRSDSRFEQGNGDLPWSSMAEHRIHMLAPTVESLIAARVAAERVVADDLRSRLGCVVEATYWDRPYDTRIAAIRGMCDLATNGMTPARAGAAPTPTTGGGEES